MTQTDTSSKLNPGKSQGRPERKARARSPSIKTAYPPAFSQQSPCPGSAEPTDRSGRSLQPRVSCLEKGKPCALTSPLRAPPWSLTRTPPWCCVVRNLKRALRCGATPRYGRLPLHRSTFDTSVLRAALNSSEPGHDGAVRLLKLAADGVLEAGVPPQGARADFRGDMTTPQAQRVLALLAGPGVVELRQLAVPSNVTYPGANFFPGIRLRVSRRRGPRSPRIGTGRDASLGGRTAGTSSRTSLVGVTS